jgi:DNA-binding MarR family transcriptional regulator
MVNNLPSDLAIAVVGAARVVADRLADIVQRAGVADMRAPYGYVIRVLADRGRTLTEVAELLAVTKQAAIKVIDEMDAAGFLTREPHPSDRRIKVLRLTDKGMTVRRAALAGSRRMESELRKVAGDSDVDVFLRTLMTFLDINGASDDAGAGRSRAVW